MNIKVSTAKPTGRGFAISVVAATVVSAIVNTVISLIAQALGADAQAVAGLQVPAFIVFTVIGLLIAGGAWTLIRARAAHPSAVMRVLVPVVVVLSLIPDVLVGVAGLGWIGAVALMLMHLVVAAAGVTAFRRFLPLPA